MRAYKKIVFIAFALFMIAVSACKKDQNVIDMHYDYFDLSQGRYITYNVTKIKHDAGAIDEHETLYYQLKTVIGEIVTDNEGRSARKFYRYIRNNTSESWGLSDVWIALIADRKAELVEENKRIIKFVFAPSLNKSWNMNAYNQDDELECYFQDLHEPYAINGLSFDSTVRVEQELMDPTLIDYRRKYEIYANNVGLVYKYYKHLTIENFDTLSPTFGDELYYSVSSYGFD